MPTIINPATLAFDDEGAPVSAEFADIYHNRDSGPGQAQHVFLHGNDLPARWAGASVFTIVETGFGIGLNFLVTWQAWEADAARCNHLHFVSTEKHPFAPADLDVLHGNYPQLAPQAAALRAAWPPATPGLHRLNFADGRVTLTLAFGDAAVLADQLSAGADAFYLDGFSPDRNPDMWSPRLMNALARHARPGATVATYTTARVVRDALAAAGFVCGKQPGFAPKRDMLAGRYAPSWPRRDALRARTPISDRRAIVVGAGLAGASVAQRLAHRGWSVDVIERGAAPASGSSGLYAGVFQPHIASDDGFFSRLSRAGFLHAIREWRNLHACGAGILWQQCGALTLGDNDDDASRMRQALLDLHVPEDYARPVSRDEATAIAGMPVATGGTWIADAGWMRASSLIHAQLLSIDPRRLHLGRKVARIERVGDMWIAYDSDGAPIADAPVLILANSHDAARLVDFGTDAVNTVRGQLTYLPAPPFTSPRTVVCGDGYVLPAIDGIAVAGASFERDNTDPQPDDANHAANLARAERLLPGSSAAMGAASLRGEVGFRFATSDRLPMIGAVADIAAARSSSAQLAGAHLSDLPRVPGLFTASGYGSRGLTWAMLAAELLACQLDDEPLPIERALADAVDPGRFILKHVRRSTL